MVQPSINHHLYIFNKTDPDILQFHYITMLISVIIPIYRVEKYLEQCVMSVLKQTYQDIEVILVNDGSPDNCPAICDALAQNDTRIKVIHKHNGGLSDARNVGTQTATGDYILYMDSDDFWSSTDDLAKLVNAAKETPECDFIGFNCSYYYEAEDKIVPWVKFDREIAKTTTSDNCIEKLVASGVFPMSACMKLIKKDCIHNNNIQFIKGIYGEDIPWFIELLKKSDRCRFINHYMYIYRKGLTTSISGSFSYKKYSDLLNILKDGVAINQQECEGETRNALFSFWAYELCILRAMTGFMDKKQQKKELKELYKFNWLFKFQLHPKVRKVKFMQKFLGKRITNLFLYQYLRTRLA